MWNEFIVRDSQDDQSEREIDSSSFKLMGKIINKEFNGFITLQKIKHDQRKVYTCVSDRNREQLLRMIYADGYSCHKAARMLKIAYNNAKVILTVFRKEGRIKQIPIRLKRLVADFKTDPYNLKKTLDQQTYKEMRKIFFPKLDFIVKSSVS